MKIVFLQDDFPPESLGGAGFSTYELACGMHMAGNEVYVITTCRKEADAGRHEYDGLIVYRVVSNNTPRWRAWESMYSRAVPRVERILKELRPDVVHINNIHIQLSYHCFAIARKYASAVMFTARDTMAVYYDKLATERYLSSFDPHTTWRDRLAQAGKGYNPFRNVMIRRYVACAHRRFAVSEALRRALEENGIKDVGVIHTGVDVKEWEVSEEKKIDFRKKHATEGKRVILFAGRLSEGKGGRKAIDALALICKTVPEAVLLVAGKIDTYAETMKGVAKGYGLEKNLLFTGWVDRSELKVAYATSDVVLLPSLYLDPFPRIAIEAMAMGKPVVGTCYGGAPEIILDGITGYIVNPFDTEALGKKITTLLTDSRTAERFGVAGRERVRNEFSLSRMVEEYTDAYERVMREQGNTPVVS